MDNHAKTPYQQALTGRFPLVKGRCPACGLNNTLFLAEGGWVTCSWLKCPDPSSASDALRANVPESQKNAR